ncbi:MAG: deoxyribonuclease IV, partial [Candidatus Limnocylindrales bacterium]
MLPDGRRLGAHLPLGGGMVAAVDRAQAIGLDTLQIFSDNPTAWRRRAEPPRELAAFRSRLTEMGMGPIAIHAPYLLNLAGPDEPFYVKSVDLLGHELAVAPT